ncbi:MAG: AEC family transporter [Oscillospiraceae bacterium]
MENFIVCLNAVLPMFIIMSVGYFVKRIGLLLEDDIPRFNKIVFRVFMPCVVFYNLYSSDLSVAAQPRLILFTLAAVLGSYAVIALIVPRFVKNPEQRGVMIQGIYRSNYVVIGLPIATALVPASELGIVSLLIAFVVPVFNVLAVVTLEVFRGGRVPVRKTLVSILTNPLIIGAALGTLALALKIKLPTAADSVVRQLASVGTPLQLFLLGGFFNFSGIAKHKKPLFWAVFGKLVLLPAAVLPIAVLLGFRGTALVALVGCFASGNAIASFVMTQQMGGDAELAGDIVVLTSSLCAVTVFCWLFLLKTLGLF